MTAPAPRRQTIPQLPRVNPARRSKRKIVRRMREITALRRRSENRLPSAPTNPLGAYAVGADGSTFRTSAIVTSQAYTIREVFQTPSGSTWSIRLDVVPATTPTSLKVNMHGGMHATTRRTHPANGTWTLAAGANAWTFELVGSTFVAGCIWETGCATAHVPGSESDAAAECNRLSQWARDHAPAMIYLPAGGMYIQSAMIRWPESAAVIAQGGRRTFFWVADLADMPVGSPVTHAMGTGAGTGTTGRNVSNAYWYGFTIYGARHTSAYARGYHAVDLGSDSDTGVALSIVLEDIGIVGAGGYSKSFGGGNAKAECYVIRCRFLFSDNDNIDLKNKIDGNFAIHYDACRFGWHALGSQGTNLQPTYTLTANSVTTTIGETTFTIPRSTDSATQPGEYATMVGPTYNGINLTGTFRVTATDSTTITLDTVSQTANASGTGGGSGITFNCPHISDGDVANDMRGIFVSMRNPVWRGECFGRNVFRGRGGTAGIGNGLGASYCSIVGARGYDQTESWVRATGNTGNFLSLLGVGMIATDFAFYTSGGASGFIIGADSLGCIASNFYVEGSDYGFDCRGDRAKIATGEIKDYTISGALLDGATTSLEQVLTDDPFTATVLLGSSPTTTNVKAPAHSQAASFTVAFSGAHSDYGLTITPSNVGSYTATKVDADNFTVPLVGSATSLDAFGGENVQARYGTTAHIAPDITVSNVTFRLTAARTASSKEITTTTRVLNAKIVNCVFSSGAGEDAAITDNGIGTIWGPGNSGGIWNAQRVYDLPTSGSVTLTVGDGGKMLLLPSNAASQVTVNLPAVVPPGWWIEAQANNSVGIKLQTTTSGTITNANNSSSNPGSIASSTTGATIKLAYRSSSGFRVLYTIGTWTLA